MSTPTAAALALVVLAAAGAVPCLVLCGRRWRSVLLAPLAGSALAAVSAMGTLAVGGDILGWFVGLSVSSSVAFGAWWYFTPPEDLVEHRSRDPRVRAVGASAAVLVVAGASFSLVALRAPWVGFDARSIWMLHAVWFAGGHTTAIDALRAGSMSFAHPSYPPLLSATVALAWRVSGDHSYRLGVVMVSCLNAASVSALGWATYEVSCRLAGVVRGHLSVFMAALGAVVSVLLTLAVFGVAGPFATNGYADLLWSSAAVGAVVYGLVLPGRAGDVEAAAILLAVSGLTKDEGIVLSMAIVVLVTIRRAVGNDHWRRPCVAGGVGVLCLGAWPALVRILGVRGDVSNLGTNKTSDFTRARLTFDAMVPHLHVLALAVPLSVVGAAVAWRTRRAAALGNDAWSWTAIAIGTAVIAAVYVTGPGNVELWLVTSVHRTTTFTAIGAWLEIGVWTVVSASAFARRSATRSPPDELRTHIAGDAAGAPLILDHHV